jgi:hypothetical protein
MTTYRITLAVDDGSITTKTARSFVKAVGVANTLAENYTLANPGTDVYTEAGVWYISRGTALIADVTIAHA